MPIIILYQKCGVKVAFTSLHKISTTILASEIKSIFPHRFGVREIYEPRGTGRKRENHSMLNFRRSVTSNVDNVWVSASDVI